MGSRSKWSVSLISLVAVATGFVAYRTRRRSAGSGPRLHILEYHDVGEGPEETEGVISSARFRHHIRYLKRRFRIETVSRAAELVRSGASSQQDLVALTFDDGLIGNHRWAWPVLRAEGVPATIFVTTGFLDGTELWFDFARRALRSARRPGTKLPERTRRLLQETYGGWPRHADLERMVDRLKRLSPESRADLLASLREANLEIESGTLPLRWDHVRELHSAGIEIGGHSVSHPILSTLSAEEQQAEIAGCRKRIADEIGAEPTCFAYPNGSANDFNDATVEILRASSFRTACTTIRGPNGSEQDPYRLRRIGVGSDSNLVLAARMAGLFDEGLRRRLRRVGWRQ